MENANIIRCSWCGTDPLYIKYHDEEWGKEIHDDKPCLNSWYLNRLRPVKLDNYFTSSRKLPKGICQF